ncbi:hypothetical protein VTN77DRAFT_689 [Rasamsonia byssochlamydoides]|uniref:uncharacterized protein n=1 Tax=Rasamsonia byssochlamydoides TaxID=89139 RepID=UPI003742BBB7
MLRAKDPQAIIYLIDTKTKEIRPEDEQVYTKLQGLGDELPDSLLSFILLSYPLMLSSGCLTVPYVLYYLPENCKLLS